MQNAAAVMYEPAAAQTFFETNWLMSCFRSLLSHVKHAECWFASCQAVSAWSGKLDQDSDLYQPLFFFFHFAPFILARLCAVALSHLERTSADLFEKYSVKLGIILPGLALVLLLSGQMFMRK